MLPVYEALDIVKVIAKNVGHTQPWVIIANTPQGLQSFVVKLYTTAQIEHRNSVTAEVVCNKLANDFSFNSPKAAFIEIPEQLLFNKPPEWQMQFDTADARPKFATEEIEHVNQAIATLPKKYFANRISLDTLYAFDNFIKNADRGIVKTNLLVGKKAWLIDHEMALSSTDIGINIIANEEINHRFTKHHLFFHYLKSAKRVTKKNYFDEFSEYLRILSVNSLDPYFNQLEQLGYQTNKQQIKDWVQQVKQNSTTFVNSLKGSLQ